MLSFRHSSNWHNSNTVFNFYKVIQLFYQNTFHTKKKMKLKCIVQIHNHAAYFNHLSTNSIIVFLSSSIKCLTQNNDIIIIIMYVEVSVGNVSQVFFKSNVHPSVKFTPPAVPGPQHCWTRRLLPPLALSCGRVSLFAGT